MAEEGFRLPESSYDVLAKIIKAYSIANDEVGADELSHRSAIHPTVISRNNAFLVGIGVITGGRKKACTAIGKELGHALDHGIEEEIRARWRDVVLANEFLQKVLSAIRIRKGMDPSTLHAHIAYSAGQAKKESVMTGARTLVDILEVAGLVREQDGKVLAVADELPPTTDLTGAPRSGTWAPTNTSRGTSPSSAAAVSMSGQGVVVTIQIQIQCTASDVESLGPKIRALLREISSPVTEDEPKPVT